MASSLMQLGMHSGQGFKAVWDVILGPRMAKVVGRFPTPDAATYSLGAPLRDLGRLFIDDSRLRMSPE